MWMRWSRAKALPARELTNAFLARDRSCGRSFRGPASRLQQHPHHSGWILRPPPRNADGIVGRWAWHRNPLLPKRRSRGPPQLRKR